MTRTSGRAGRLPPDERRAAIVAATLPLVLRDGAGVSTRQIAEAAGIAEGTIFRVFPDKDALMRAVLAEAFDPHPTLHELAEVDRSRPLRERLRDVVTIVQRRLTGVFVLIDALGLRRPPEDDDDCGDGPPTTNHMNDAFRAAIADVVGPDAHLLRVSTTEFAHVLRLLTFSASHPRITDGMPLSADQIVAVLLDGLLDHPAARTATDRSDHHHHARPIEV